MQKEKDNRLLGWQAVILFVFLAGMVKMLAERRG